MKVGAVLLLGVLVSPLACDGGFDLVRYKMTVKSGKVAVPVAVQMEELFGDADHFITHFGLRAQRTHKWNTEIHFGGRYSLTMQVDVRIDYKKNAVSVAGDPSFYVVELAEIEDLKDGRFAATAGAEKKFGLKEWKSLYSSAGDWSSIGFEINKTEVAGFSEYVRAIRRDRIQVSLLDRKRAQKSRGGAEEDSEDDS